MVFVNLRFCVILIIVDAVNASIIFFYLLCIPAWCGFARSAGIQQPRDIPGPCGYICYICSSA